MNSSPNDQQHSKIKRKRSNSINEKDSSINKSNLPLMMTPDHNNHQQNSSNSNNSNFNNDKLEVTNKRSRNSNNVLQQQSDSSNNENNEVIMNLYHEVNDKDSINRTNMIKNIDQEKLNNEQYNNEVIIPLNNKFKRVKKELIKNNEIENNTDDITNENYMNALDDFSYELEENQSKSSRDNLGIGNIINNND